MPAARRQLSPCPAPDPTTAGIDADVTVTAKDAFGNMATGYTGTVHFTSSDGQAVLPGNYTFTAGDAGRPHLRAVTLKTAGTQTITATDTVTGPITGTGQRSAVTRRPPPRSWSSAPGHGHRRSAFNVTVTAQDAYGNTATGYTGTVHFTSSDGQAVLPGQLHLHRRRRTAPTPSRRCTLKTAGNQTITATDTVTRRITGTRRRSRSTRAAATQLRGHGLPGPTDRRGGAQRHGDRQRRLRQRRHRLHRHGPLHQQRRPGACLPANYTFTAGDAGRPHLHQRRHPQDCRAPRRSRPPTRSQRDDHRHPSERHGRAAADRRQPRGHGLPSPATAGRVAHNVTVTAKDAYGNMATGYTGHRPLHQQRRPGGCLPGRLHLHRRRRTACTPSPVTLKTAGTQTITATDTVTGTITGTERGHGERPAAAASLTVTGPGLGHRRHGVQRHGHGRGRLRQHGHRLHGAPSTSPAVRRGSRRCLPANYTFTGGDQGVHTFTVTLKTAAPRPSRPPTPSHGTITGTRAHGQRWARPPPPASRSQHPATATAGTPVNVTVTAHDQFGNMATGYTGHGPLHQQSTPRPVLPADYTFTAGDARRPHLHDGVTLKTAGTQTIDRHRHRDSGHHRHPGERGGRRPAAAASLTVTGFRPRPPPALAFNVTVTAKDAYGNTATGYTGTVHFTSSPTATAVAARRLHLHRRRRRHPHLHRGHARDGRAPRP